MITLKNHVKHMNLTLLQCNLLEDYIVLIVHADLLIRINFRLPSNKKSDGEKIIILTLIF